MCFVMAHWSFSLWNYGDLFSIQFFIYLRAELNSNKTTQDKTNNAVTEGATEYGKIMYVLSGNMKIDSFQDRGAIFNATKGIY
jgi:hypothetical protein